jgi:hypothetical protein
MLTRPKKRIWPSVIDSRRSKVRRQPLGEMNGSRPSNTSIRAIAAHSRSLLKRYFRVAGAAGAALPRKARKKSLADGSTTTRSLFLLNVDL